MKKRLQFVVGIVLMVALLWFVFRGTNWAEVWQAVSRAHLGWMLLCLVMMILSFFARAQRWSYIVRTAKPVSYGVLFDATQIGFLGNFTLPARAGEAIRALVLARLASLPVTKCLAFGFLDCVTDLFGLLAVLGITVFAYRPEQAVHFPPGFELPDWAAGLLDPAAIRRGAAMIAVAIAGLVVFMVAIYVRTDWVLAITRAVFSRISPSLSTKAEGIVQHFSDGLHILRSAPAMFGAVGFSLLTWGVSGVSLWAAMMAFDLQGPWYAAPVVLAVLSVVISAPSTPGFVGAFHLGIMMGLFIVVDDVSLSAAKAMAIFYHLANLIPILAFGIWSLMRRQVGLLQLEREAEIEAK